MPCSITKGALDCILPASKLRIGLLPLILFSWQPCGISWQACTKKLLLSLIDVLTNLAKNAKCKGEIMIEISSPQQPVETKIITRKRLLTNVTMSRWALPTILVFQALLCWILLKNTAFEDEALYIYAGEQIWQHWLHGLPLLENYSYFISGNPYVYPIIAGPLDMLGGLELVRSFSLVCMLIVTSCGYYVTKQLFDQKSAIFAAIFFVCQGPVLFLSRLATYDSLCLCLVAIGMALAVNASLAQRPWRALGIGPFLVLAFFAKYAALLFIPPVLATLALCTLLRWGWISMLVRGTLGVLSLAVVGTLGAIVVIRFDPSMLHALVASTTDRIVNQERSATARYLTEQFEILRYYLADDTYTWQWTGPYFFEYTDKQGHYYIGNEAYVKAINDGYFDLIELDYGNTIQTDILIAQAIEHSKKYDLIQQIPNRDSYGTGYFFIWRKR